MAVTIITPSIDMPQMIGSKFLQAQIVINAAITNTGTHDPTNDVTFVMVDARAYPGAKTLVVVNSLDQDASVNVVTSLDGVSVFSLATASTATKQTTSWFDPSRIAPLAYPFIYLGLKAVCAIAPTTGTLNAYLLMRTI